MLTLCGALTSMAAAQTPSLSPEQQVLDQASQQALGEYPSINQDYLQPLGLTQKAWSDPLRNLGEGQTKPGFTRYLWNEDTVYPLRLREGMNTLLNLPQGEVVENIYIGDPVTFSGGIAGSDAVLLHPNKAGADTNVIIFGRSGNRYVFYARSESYNAERLTHQIVDVVVANAADQTTGAPPSGRATLTGAARSPLEPVAALATARDGKVDWATTIGVDPSQFKFDLAVYLPEEADAVIAPERVWRDDIFTYIDFGERALTMTQRPIPRLLVQDVESPVGFRTTGPNSRLMIVEAVGDMVLRNGARTVCITLDDDTPAPEPLPTAVARDPADPASPMAPPRPGPVPFTDTPSIVPASGGLGLDLGSLFSRDEPAKPDLFLEFGIGTSEEELRRRWGTLLTTSAGQLAGLQPQLAVAAPADGASEKPIMRLEAGPVDAAAGSDICANLAQRGLHCAMVYK